MKKLMIAVAAVAMAVAAEAAKVTWNSGTLYTAGKEGKFTTTEVADDAVAGYLFILNETQFNAFYKTYTDNDYETMSASVYDTYKNSLKTAISATSEAGSIDITDNVKYDSGKDVYAALIYITKDANGNDCYIANIGDFTAKTSNKTAYDYGVYEIGGGNSGTENAIAGWTVQAVPEPFSGSLALLGMGAIALRRKMKKAKKA